MLTLRRLSATAVLILVFSSAAQAAAIFDASAIATLSITSIENLTNPGNLVALSVFGDSEVLAEETLLGGGGLAGTSSGAAVIGALPLLGLDHLAAADGTADALGSAEAFVLTDGSLSFENTSSSDTFLVMLLLDFQLIAAAAVDDATTEDAFSSALLTLLSESPAIHFNSVVLADALLGPPSHADGGRLAFQLLVGPGASDSVFLSTSAIGFAGAREVPEPSTLSSMALLVALLALERRRWGRRL
jgi:hypothetical protein